MKKCPNCNYSSKHCLIINSIKCSGQAKTKHLTELLKAETQG